MRNYLCDNPLVLQRADPWIHKHTDGYYYFTASVPEFDRIEIRKTRNLSDLGGGESVVIWRKRTSGVMSANIWAPELHFIDSRWYVYFAAANNTEPRTGLYNHRIFVLENGNTDPLSGGWIERGQIITMWDSFSLDATTFESGGTRYLVWAQKDPRVAGNSNLYIAVMKNPWTLNGRQVMLSKPELPWEMKGYLVNEGPAVLVRGGKIFITYSCSATDANYCMGLLSANAGSDLLNPRSWTKSPVPVFETSEKNSQYGPGHNCFTADEEGLRDLLVYHARNYREIAGDPLHDPNRHTRIQCFGWTEEGNPDFGVPLKDGPLFLGL